MLRGEWGFDGFVISDWFGTHSTAPAAEAGLDLEMPGPPKWFGAPLADAVTNGTVDRIVVERMAERLHTLAERTGALNGEGGGEPGSYDDPDHRALIRDAAAASFVLLKNDGAAAAARPRAGSRRWRSSAPPPTRSGSWAAGARRSTRCR